MYEIRNFFQVHILDFVFHWLFSKLSIVHNYIYICIYRKGNLFFFPPAF